VKIQEIFPDFPCIATLPHLFHSLLILPPRSRSHSLLVDGTLYSSRNWTAQSSRNPSLVTKMASMLSLCSDSMRRRPDLAKMCWSCATKFTSTRSLSSRLSLPRQYTSRAFFSSQSRVVHDPPLTTPHPLTVQAAPRWSAYRLCTYFRSPNIQSRDTIPRPIRISRQASEWRYTRTAAQVARRKWPPTYRSQQRLRCRYLWRTDKQLYPSGRCRQFSPPG
jgi:hypothetical protein